jgi:hypothetical protein
MVAVKYQNCDVVMHLINDASMDPSGNNQEILKLACTKEWTNIVEKLLTNERVHPNSDGTNECLRLAALHNN